LIQGVSQLILGLTDGAHLFWFDDEQWAKIEPHLPKVPGDANREVELGLAMEVQINRACRSAMRYSELVESRMPIGNFRGPEKGRGRLLDLEGSWFQCEIEYTKCLDNPLWVVGSMSSSPIVCVSPCAALNGRERLAALFSLR
jgi:hypothetical protein